MVQAYAEEKVTKKNKLHWLHFIVAIMIMGYFQPFVKLSTPSPLRCDKGKDTQMNITPVSTITPFAGEPLCPIPEKVAIKEHDIIQYILHDEDYRLKSADLLSKAVEVDTIVFDKMENYDKMAKFHSYLEENFPLVYKTAKVTKVNEYGLIFEFPGTNADLKPILFMAHQDTVPIGDPNDWTESPFSGRYDGVKVFGRGASDCKTLLVSLMESAEMIIKDDKLDFERGVIFSFGFDEEKSGFDGAQHLGEWLVNKYGEDSVDHIIDEGPMMFMEQLGDYYAVIPTGEKGYFDFEVEVFTPGGHSSMPRDHTSIGIMSKFLVAYEEDTFDPLLDLDNPVLGMFECVAEQGRLPPAIAKAAREARVNPESNKELTNFIAEHGGPLKLLITTTQAIDIVEGGDKANALPRVVKSIINHRITYGNSAQTVWDKAIKHATWVAHKYGLGLESDGEVLIEATEAGNIVLSAYADPLETAKVTPLYDDIYNKFTGTIKSFYEDEVFPEKFEEGSDDKKFIIVPALMSGNTDTRHYWKLTDHIFRVQPGSMDFFKANIHGPNEYTEVDSHLQQVAFYYNYILDNAASA